MGALHEVLRVQLKFIYVLPFVEVIVGMATVKPPPCVNGCVPSLSSPLD